MVQNMVRMIVLLAFLVTRIQVAYSKVLVDSLSQTWKLQDCIGYALSHHPLIQQSLLDEQITERSIQSKLADWYPQLNFNYSIGHFPDIPVSTVQGFPVKVGLQNTSTGQFSLTQTIFNRDVLLASSSAADVRSLTRQQSANNRIDVVVGVSKAFYAVLETQEQIALLDEDIVRLKQSLKDTYEQYRSGIVDNIDYKRATILLNNVNAEKKQSEELLNARYVSLKEQMGYSSKTEIRLEYDSTQMEHEIFIDTTQTVQYDNRIEYQLLQTRKRLQEADLAYNRWSFLPSISATANYDLNYENDTFSRLYNQNYPSSFIGVQLSFPIFQGGKRLQNIRKADLELQRIDYDIQLLKNSINTEYAQAKANYISSLNNYSVLKDNLELAKEVFHTVQLQYRAGTKTYLEVITSETDLRTTQVNYISALYQVLSSKLDVQKTLGIIQY